MYHKDFKKTLLLLMETNSILLFAIVALIVLILVYKSGERFISVPYTSPGSSSIDCDVYPDSPGCTGPPPVSPVGTDLSTCTPANGVWSIPGANMAISKLNSPCCQPPSYSVAKNMKTCDDDLDTSDPIQKCIKDCCDNAATEANNYDVSWYPMSRCACSLWCYNQSVPHFKKYGTAIHYISGDIAEAQTSDVGGFIGSGDFSGQ